MKKQLEQRLQQLKAEFESGQKVLADLDAKQANVRETLLRIQGAIQVLEEELTKSNGASSEPETTELLEKEPQEI
jgi:uncharacterized coiled-coil protein SlyX